MAGAKKNGRPVLVVAPVNRNMLDSKLLHGYQAASETLEKIVRCRVQAT
jgi:hypothetical protein